MYHFSDLNGVNPTIIKKHLFGCFFYFCLAALIEFGVENTHRVCLFAFESLQKALFGQIRFGVLAAFARVVVIFDDFALVHYTAMLNGR